MKDDLKNCVKIYDEILFDYPKKKQATSNDTDNWGSGNKGSRFASSIIAHQIAKLGTCCYELQYW